MEIAQLKEFNKLVSDTLDDKSIVLSNRSTYYVEIANYMEIHVSEKSTRVNNKGCLKMSTRGHKQCKNGHYWVFILQ